MVSSNLHQRVVNSGNSGDNSPNSFLPTTTSSSENNNAKTRRQRNWFGGIPCFRRSHGNNGLFSKQSILILLFGTMLGYSVLPFLLAQTGTIGNVVTKPDHKDYRNLSDNDIMSRLIENKQLLSTQSLPTRRAPHIMETPILSDHRRKKILVTGGAGFVGSHLVDKLMMEGHEVTVVDNFFTGQKKNIAHWIHHPNFRYEKLVREFPWLCWGSHIRSSAWCEG